MARLQDASLAAAAFVLALNAGPALAATTVYTDSTFANANYTLGSFADPSVTLGAYGQTLTGGNPGAGLQGSFTTSGLNSQGVLLTALNTSFVYDPTVSGAITSLDVSLDRFANPFVDSVQSSVGNYTLRLLAEQNGALYQATYAFGPFNQTGGTWYSLAQTGISASNFFTLTSSNFATGSATGGLDFNGGAITFGFAMRSGAAVDGAGAFLSIPTSNDLRADNFSVTVNSSAPVGGVPEPASWAVMILGLGAVGGALRSRRRFALTA